ncbi:tetratricopeptide (TPR) repeat protein [Streptomyces griseochromogenes]|uniref:Tetratricopeptide (TPR) repeat protein n=1 Tax=Streptomyces griseochromogenes TaxID=68214 RepID=A0A1B1AT85_9ACTN|nr:CHAT domain-containing protein [Streptomyces griseochromogenes]ANP49783.1 hypothetical protein AVL59_09325 [Streptomyces griseochromogenes]MBP2051732.1 tetratricopeptide (TPR) repeat protein [Streptomyces griseochromogenes]
MSGSDYQAEFAASLTEQAAYLSSLGRFADALEPSTEACEIYMSTGVGDAAARAEAFTRQVIVLARLDRTNDVPMWAHLALAHWYELGAPGNRMLMARILHVISVLQILAGEDGDAVITAADAVGLAPGSRTGRRGPTELRLLVRVLTAHAMALAGAGRPGEAAEVAGEALRKRLADTAETADVLESLADPGQTHRPSPHLLLAGLDASLADIAGTRGARVAPEDSVLLNRHLMREGSDSAQPSLLTALAARFTQLSAEGRKEEAADWLSEAISTSRQLLTDGEPGYGRHVTRVMGDIGDFLWSRLDQCDAEDLDRLVDIRGLAYEGSAEAGDTGRADAAFRLGTGLLARFERGHETRDLEDLLALLRRSGERFPTSELRHGMAWLASRALTHRYDLTGDRADLYEAIEHGIKAIVADDEPGTGTGAAHVDAMSRLSHRLWHRYNTFGTPDDLEAAITLIDRSLSVLGDHHAERARLLVSLGTVLFARYDRSGDPADLDRTIDLAREASGDEPARIPALELLCTALIRRYGKSDSSHDPGEAVMALRQLISALPQGHEARAEHLVNLSVMLRQRHSRTMDSVDLQEALAAGRQAVALLSADDPRRSAALFNLTRVLEDVHKRSGDRQLLSEAVDAAEEAVSRSPDNAPDRAAVVANLAQALGARWLAQGVKADLTEAISLARHAVEILPADSPTRAPLLDLLEALLRYGVEHEADHGIRGQAMSLAFERGSPEAGLAEAIAVLRSDTAAPNALPLERIRAAERLGRLAMTAGQSEVALEGYSLAVDLLPLALAARRGRPTRRGGTEPGDLDELVNDAAAAAMAAERWEQAAVLLERGRVALLAHSPGPDQRLEYLRALDPELADHFEELGDRISRGEPRGRRPGLVAEWDRLIEQVRLLPGMSSFLAPPRFQDLAAQVQDGPLVMVNVSRYRSDAIIVTSGGVIAVPLPGLHEELPQQLRRFRSTLAARYAPLEDHLKAEGTLRDVLHWLWSAVAQPVLDTLGLRNPRPDEPLPRLWWIPTGLLGLLPLHAAEEPRAVQGALSMLDCVCPSYAATISALGEARRKPHAPLSALVVAPTGSPRVDDLPHAEREAHEVLARMGTARLLSGTEATKDAVLSQLPQASVVHFACHGVMNPGSLRAGGLELADGPLTTAELRAAQATAPQLVVLSACGTASRPAADADSPWQAVSLPATLHLGGYRHAIGTLWEVDDRTHADMASLFYAALTDRGSVSTDDSPRALHEAVRRVRARYPHIPSLWAAHIHVGP